MKFYQSLSDFPCPVTLGEKAPSFSLDRFSHGLRFAPLDDECFTFRSDNRQLLYKGYKRSHRFTLLCDTAFEYDCILLKEPESNVISLLMDGSEHFDFFIQPDFLKDPLLASSIAVYKKETLPGEGTGKLCHIHRPEIIDAKGRRCWGDLSVAGNELHITIPEKWLGEAAYPVIVDPAIGTSTIGSQTDWYDEDNGEEKQLFIEVGLMVNRYLLTETLNGNATAFVYAYDEDSSGHCNPVFYSDNNNVPISRKSKYEENFDVTVNRNKPAGWRSTTFSSNDTLHSGSYVWFGLSCDWFAPRFDFGTKCYWNFYNDNGPVIPETFPLYSASWYFSFKVSMYFYYTSSQSFVRTITQGVTLSDKNKKIVGYKRKRIEGVKVGEDKKTLVLFFRKISDIAKFDDVFKNFAVFISMIRDTFRQIDDIKRTGTHYRKFSELIESNSRAKTAWVLFSYIADKVNVSGNVLRSLLMLVKLLSTVFFRDYFFGRFLKAKQELVLKSPVCREIELESRFE